MLLDDKVEFKKISNIDDKERALVEAFSSGKDHIDSYLKKRSTRRFTIWNYKDLFNVCRKKQRKR
ncbi:hypothetical protein EFP6CSP_17585 [Enterococcus faecium]|nr:hypothetical protein EFP6CSP_17585 [Enterococcus faecium]